MVVVEVEVVEEEEEEEVEVLETGVEAEGGRGLGRSVAAAPPNSRAVFMTAACNTVHGKGKCVYMPDVLHSTWER